MQDVVGGHLVKEDVVEVLYGDREIGRPRYFHTIPSLEMPKLNNSNTGQTLPSRLSYEQLTPLSKFGENVVLLVGAA